MSHRSNAFTIVELLVVVSIIVVLIALLIPGMEQAAEHARRATCMSNQHQIAISLNFYFDDHKRFYPWGHPDAPGVIAYPQQNNAPNWDKAIPPQQLLMKYTPGARKLYRCASDPAPQQYRWFWYWNGAYRPDFPNNEGCSYMFSEEATYGNGLSWYEGVALKTSLIEGSPSNFAYMADGNYVVNSWSWVTADPLDPSVPNDANYRRLTWSHLDATNMLMGDASVGSVDHFNAQIGGLKDRVRTNAMEDRLPQTSAGPG